MADGGVVLTTSDVQPVVMAQAMPMPEMAQVTVVQAMPLEPTQIQAQPVAARPKRQNSLRRVREELQHPSPAMKALFAFVFVVSNSFIFFFLIRGPIMGCGCPSAYHVDCGHECARCECEIGNIFTCEYMCDRGGEGGGFDCYKDGELGSCMDIFGRNGSRTTGMGTGEGGNVNSEVICPGQRESDYCDCQGDCSWTDFCDCDEARAATCCGS